MTTLTEAAERIDREEWEAAQRDVMIRLQTENDRLRADFARDQAELASMRITLAEQKADLEQAARTTCELVDGLSEETRKRNVAEVEAGRLKRELETTQRESGNLAPGARCELCHSLGRVVTPT